MMKAIPFLGCALLAIALVGCSGGGGATDEAQNAKMHSMLGSGPPSLKALAGKHPMGANQKEKEGAAGGGAQPATTGQ